MALFRRFSVLLTTLLLAATGGLAADQPLNLETVIAKARAAAQSKATGLRVTVSDVLRQSLTEAVRARANDPSREPPQWSGGE